MQQYLCYKYVRSLLVARSTFSIHLTTVRFILACDIDFTTRNKDGYVLLKPLKYSRTVASRSITAKSLMNLTHFKAVVKAMKPYYRGRTVFESKIGS